MIKKVTTALFLFGFMMLGFSQSKAILKPLKVYEKDGIKLKSYNFDGLENLNNLLEKYRTI